MKTRKMKKGQKGKDHNKEGEKGMKKQKMKREQECKYAGKSKYVILINRYKMVSRPPTMMRPMCIPSSERSLGNKCK